MFKFGENHPVIFEIILMVAAFVVAAIFHIIGITFNLHPDLSNSVARILVGTALLVIYKRAFQGCHFFSNPVIVLPALLFPLWNIFYNFSAGMKLGGVPFFVEGLITAFAPAISEEVLFREIFIYNMKKKGNSDLQCLFISAAVFALVHVTNIAGMDLTSVAVQTGYAFVIGLVFAAIYLKNGSLLQVIVVHFLIDFSTRIFMASPSDTSTLQLFLFILVLVVETVYAVMLTAHKPVTDKCE